MTVPSYIPDIAWTDLPRHDRSWLSADIIRHETALGAHAAAINTNAAAITTTAAAGATTAAAVTSNTTRIGNLEYPTSMRSWHAGLANREYGPSNILWFGDSISEGEGATLKARRGIDRMQAQLRSRYPTPNVAGGEGFVPASWLETTFSTGWTYTGSQSSDFSFGFGHRSRILTSPDGAITRAVSGTSLDVYYLTASTQGTFAVYLDGSGTPATTVNTASASFLSGQVAHLSLGTRGSHTVKVAWLSGGSVYIEGVRVYDQDESVGIHVIDSSKYGTTTPEWAISTNFNASFLSTNISVIQPSLCIIELGANDYRSNYLPSDTQAHIIEIMNQVVAACTAPPSFLLVGAYLVPGTFTYPWTQYLAGMAAIAAARTDTLFLDLTQRMVGPPPGLLGLYEADATHPSEKGHALIADIVTQALLPR